MSDIAMSLFTRILVGLDGSKGSQLALEWAAGLAASTDAEIVAAHVLTYDHEFGRDLTFDTMRPWRRELEHDLRDKWTEPLRRAHVRHRCVFLEAESPALGLLELASRECADLVVVGSHGRGNVAGRVRGGLSYRLAHHAHQPIVVVPSSWIAPEARRVQPVS